MANWVFEFESLQMVSGGSRSEVWKQSVVLGKVLYRGSHLLSPNKSPLESYIARVGFDLDEDGKVLSRGERDNTYPTLGRNEN